MTRPPTRLLHVSTTAMSLVFLRGQVGCMQQRGMHGISLCGRSAMMARSVIPARCRFEYRASLGTHRLSHRAMILRCISDVPE